MSRSDNGPAFFMQTVNDVTNIQKYVTALVV